MECGGKRQRDAALDCSDELKRRRRFALQAHSKGNDYDGTYFQF